MNDPSNQQVKEGLGLIIIGFFYKLVLADNSGKIVEKYLNYHNESLTSYEVLIGLTAFSIKIYADFYGYCKIAKNN